MNELELTGRSRTHIAAVENPACQLHRDAVQPFLDMRAAAAVEGIDLTVTSGFRDFETQLKIWNEKFRGRRPLYDRSGTALEYSALTESQLVETILYWSAVPGASRHHWGSEIDVFDRATLSDGQKVHLLPMEYEAGGPFAKLTAWLDRNMQRFGFFRPYRTDRGGVSPELWHLSYAPVSVEALKQLTVDVLQRTLLESEIEGKASVLERLPEIYRRYLTNVDLPEE